MYPVPTLLEKNPLLPFDQFQPEIVAAPSSEPETKLQLFLQWLQVSSLSLSLPLFLNSLTQNGEKLKLQANGGELRGCSIKYCGPSKGFGIFSNENTCDNGNHFQELHLNLFSVLYLCASLSIWGRYRDGSPP